MPPLNFFSRSRIVFSALCCAQLFSISLQAVEFEIAPMVGQTFSPDLTNGTVTDLLSTTNEPNFALALNWQDSPSGQGQVLVNYISRDFTDDIDQSTHSFNTIYTHFSGVAFFQERNYLTTFGFGLGATYFDTEFDDVFYPSLTVALGARYDLSETFTLITELRGYATFVNDNDTLFCQEDNCYAHFHTGIWFDSQLSIGVAYSF